MSNVLDEIFSSDSTPKVTASDLEGFSIDDLLEGTTPVNKVDVMENQKPSSVAPSLNDVDEEFADIFGTSTSPERSVEIPSKAAAATSTNHLDFLAWLDAADDPDASNTVASSDNEIGIDTELVANATINDSDSWISRDPAQALEEMAQAETGKVNVEQMRRMCQSLGGILPSHLRAHIWSVLLGVGEGENELDSWVATGGLQRAATMPRALELRQDAAMLAERMTTGETPTQDEIAEKIRTVVSYFCIRRALPYERVLCCIAAPLASFQLGTGKISDLFYRLANSYTLFLATGMAEDVRLIAARQAHRQFYFLCAYHSPLLAQHLDRCYPGWEMPILDGKLKHQEVQQQDEEAAALVDDLERRAYGGRPMLQRHTDQEASQSCSSEDHFALHRAKLQQVQPFDGNVGGTGADSTMDGVICHSLLCALYSSLAWVAPNPETLLPLWDYYLIRRDKHFGYFLLLALLLRSKSDLQELTGADLRHRLAAVLRGETISCNLDESGVHQWCLEAEALDLSTPESFRFTVGRIGETSQAEYAARVREAASLTGEIRASAVDKIISEQQEADFSTLPSIFTQNSPTKSVPTQQRPISIGRKMKEMMADASKKVAEQVDSIKAHVVEELEHRERSSTGVSPPNKMRTPLPGTMPQLCLTIMPFEMIASIGRKEGLGRVAAEAKEDTESGKSLSQVLHQQRRPINYFAVDCRPADAMSSGKFPTAYHLDPATLQDPDKISKVLEDLEPLLGKTHICLLGGGEEYVASHYRLTAGITRAAMEDYSCVNTCALFFAKRGFPYISIVKGGYAAAHEVLAGGQADPTNAIDLGTLVDHSSRTCRLCKHEALRRFSLEHRAEPAQPLAQGSSPAKMPSTGRNLFSRLKSSSRTLSMDADDLNGDADSNVESSTREPNAPWRVNLGSIGSVIRRASSHEAPAGIAPSTSPRNRVAALWARGMRLASSDGAVPNHSDDGAAVDSVPSLGGEVDSGLFVIGDDEDSESDGENTSKTVSEEERKDIALREHKLSGLTKGCAIASSDYESLPGCITFGVQKLKAETSSELPRVLLLTRERMLVLNCPPGQGGGGTVRSNRHLSQITRMTYLKSQPSTVSLHHSLTSAGEGGTKGNTYRLGNTVQRNQLIAALRQRLQRFA